MVTSLLPRLVEVGLTMALSIVVIEQQKNDTKRTVNSKFRKPKKALKQGQNNSRNLDC